MGLGKTVQVLAFVSVVQNKTGRPYDEIRLNHARHIGFPVVLIVCPASVLDNWHEETRRWGYFATEVAKTNEKIEQVLDQLQRRRLDIVIMSYAKLRHFNQVSVVDYCARFERDACASRWNRFDLTSGPWLCLMRSTCARTLLHKRRWQPRR